MNKADGALADLARHTAADYAARAAPASARVTTARSTRVRTCSALLGDGIDELWERGRRRSWPRPARRESSTRGGPTRPAQWMWSEVTDTLLDELKRDPAVRAEIDALEARRESRPDVARGGGT